MKLHEVLCPSFLNDGSPCGRLIDKEDKTTFYRDHKDHHWCPEHLWNGVLLDWGRAHGYPDVRFGLFALGPGAYLWEMQVVCSREEVALYARDALQLTTREEAA